MGKEPVADYYPSGATEPIVRPLGIQVPAAAEAPEEKEETKVETNKVVTHAVTKTPAKKK